MVQAPVSDSYHYGVAREEDDDDFMAICMEFPSLSFFAGTVEQALAGIRGLVNDVLAEMRETGETPPEPFLAGR